MSAVARKIAVDVATAPDHGRSLAHRRGAAVRLAPSRSPRRSSAGRLPEGSDVAAVLADLADALCRARRQPRPGRRQMGVPHRRRPAFLLARDVVEPRKLSRAAMETLAIVAYHQPVTRAEIEEIRGVATSKGTLDTLLETGWVRLRGRRKAPGRPVTYGTTPALPRPFRPRRRRRPARPRGAEGRRPARGPHPARPVGAGPLRRHDAARRRGPARRTTCSSRFRSSPRPSFGSRAGRRSRRRDDLSQE